MRRLNPHRDYLQIFGMSKGNSPSVLLLADTILHVIQKQAMYK
jgi:hypothetical protein